MQGHVAKRGSHTYDIEGDLLLVNDEKQYTAIKKQYPPIVNYEIDQSTKMKDELPLRMRKNQQMMKGKMASRR